MPTESRLKVESIGPIQVVRFMDRHLFDDRVVRDVAEQVFRLLPPPGTPALMVVDLSGVDSLSSAMLGKLILLQRKVEAAQGQLRLCSLSETTQAVLKTTNLEKLFRIMPDAREAVDDIQKQMSK